MAALPFAFGGRMERKRVNGRFVKEGAVAEEEMEKAESRVATSKPRPRQCRTYARKRIADALPDIVSKFAEEAKKGSIQHMKILTRLGGLDGGELPPPKKRRPKSIMAKLLEDLKKPTADGADKRG